MRTVEEKLNSLTPKSVWYFAKQDTNFDNAFIAVKIFEGINDRANTNIEDYYRNYNGPLDFHSNHRALSVAQMYGLLTKTNPFERAGRYNTEECTPVFKLLNKYPIGSEKYNAIKTEQLLKLRMSAITDSRVEAGLYKINPLLFIFEVFWELHKRGIESISVPQFYTYIMTCQSHDELYEAVELLSTNPQPSQFVDKYIENSRVATILQNNLNLLHFNNNRVSITPEFVKYFTPFFSGPYTAIVRMLDMILNSTDIYIKVLTNYIGLDLDFVNIPDIHVDIQTPSEQKTITLSPIMKNFITALRTKPFLLLAGISGTGKSRKVKELAYMTCKKGSALAADPTSPGNYCLIEVKPNWHDSTELLGYYSNLSGKYSITPFIHFAYKAIQNPDVPFFVCLDEMNLAPVEQYFAEYLSVLETRRVFNGKIESSELLKKEDFNKCEIEKDGEKIYSGDELDIINYLKVNGLRLPENLFVIGTVNMDDTTHQFSRKVIDRAFTIEMNGDDLRGMFDAEDTLVYPENELKLSDLKPEFVQAADALADPQISLYANLIKETVPARLDSINTILNNTPFKVSYRVQNELVLYISTLISDNHPSSEEQVKSIIDQATLIVLLEKILPRVQGDENMLGDALKDLKQLVENEYSNLSKEDVYKEVVSKLNQMQNRLTKSYFANFF